MESLSSSTTASVTAGKEVAAEKETAAVELAERGAAAVTEVGMCAEAVAVEGSSHAVVVSSVMTPISPTAAAAAAAAELTRCSRLLVAAAA